MSFFCHRVARPAFFFSVIEHTSPCHSGIEDEQTCRAPLVGVRHAGIEDEQAAKPSRSTCFSISSLILDSSISSLILDSGISLYVIAHEDENDLEMLFSLQMATVC